MRLVQSLINILCWGRNYSKYQCCFLMRIRMTQSQILFLIEGTHSREWVIQLTTEIFNLTHYLVEAGEGKLWIPYLHFTNGCRWHSSWWKKAPLVVHSSMCVQPVFRQVLWYLSKHISTERVLESPPWTKGWPGCSLFRKYSRSLSLGAMLAYATAWCLWILAINTDTVYWLYNLGTILVITMASK